MRLYTSGVEVPKLGSLKDRVLRDFMTRESRKDIYFANMLALVASTNPVFEADQSGKAQEWATRIKSVFTSYSSAALGLELTKTDTQEAELQDAYNRFVRTLRPKLQKGEHGLAVTGLDGLFIAHGERPPVKPPEMVPQTEKIKTKSDPRFKPG